MARKRNVQSVVERLKRRPVASPCRKGFANHLPLEVTVGARARLHHMDAWNAMRRFLACDWGNADGRTVRANNRATVTGRGLVYGYYEDRRGTEFQIVAQFPRDDRLLVTLASEMR